MARNNCTAAIYDCSYYLFILKEPLDDSFRLKILNELSTILTEDSFFNTSKPLVNMDSELMPSAEFSLLPIEIYDFTISDSSYSVPNFKILDFKTSHEFVERLSKVADAERKVNLFRNKIILMVFLLNLIYSYLENIFHYSIAYDLVPNVIIILVSSVLLNMKEADLKGIIKYPSNKITLLIFLLYLLFLSFVYILNFSIAYVLVPNIIIIFKSTVLLLRKVTDLRRRIENKSNFMIFMISVYIIISLFCLKFFLTIAFVSVPNIIILFVSIFLILIEIDGIKIDITIDIAITFLNLRMLKKVFLCLIVVYLNYIFDHLRSGGLPFDFVKRILFENLR